MAVLPVDARSQTFSSASGAASVSAYVPPQAGSTDYVWVEILDSNLVSRGPIQFVSLNAQLNYNAVGSWSIMVPYTDALWNLIMNGEVFININWRGLFSFGGKVEQPGYQDSIPGAAGSSRAGPFINLSGADYLGLIANRICYPNPGVAWGSQTAGAVDVVSSMKLETAIKHYVNNNIGPGAIVARRNTSLDIATDLARGPNVFYGISFGTGTNLNLFDTIRVLIDQGNTPMGVKVTRNPLTHRLAFDCYIPRDLSGKAWFSESLGNLTAINFSLTDPTCTDALVQGAASFVSRVATAKTKWNVTEDFFDNSSETDVNNTNAVAQQAIATGAAGPVMSASVTDTPFLTYGRDYGLGDIISIEVLPGAVYTDVVSSVALTADPSQNPPMSLVPTIGHSSAATDTDQSIIGQLSARIRALEKKLATK